MLTQEIPECPFPILMRNGQVKKYAELSEKKSQGDGWGDGGLAMFFCRVGLRVTELKFQPWPPGL